MSKCTVTVQAHENTSKVDTSAANVVESDSLFSRNRKVHNCIKNNVKKTTTEK